MSAYARAGSQCVHNLNYWNFGDYLGAGAGAHGKLSDARHGTIGRSVREREPRRYLARGAHEPLTLRAVAHADLPFEFMMNALRLVDGFSAARFEERTGLPWPVVEAPVTRLVERGLLEHAEGGWRATALGQRFLNDAIAEFLPVRQKIPERPVV